MRTPLPRFLAMLLPLALGSCVTASNVPPEIAAAIPNDARAIRVYSAEAPAFYYQTVYRALVARGFAIAHSDERMATLSTEFREIEGQGTTLKINVFVESATDSGSVATLRGQWGVPASVAAGMSFAFGMSAAGGSAEEARWGASGRPKAAFGEMAVVASALPHTRLEYSPR